MGAARRFPAGLTPDAGTIREGSPPRRDRLASRERAPRGRCSGSKTRGTEWKWSPHRHKPPQRQEPTFLDQLLGATAVFSAVISLSSLLARRQSSSYSGQQFLPSICARPRPRPQGGQQKGSCGSSSRPRTPSQLDNGPPVPSLALSASPQTAARMSPMPGGKERAPVCPREEQLGTEVPPAQGTRVARALALTASAVCVEGHTVAGCGKIGF